MAARRHAAFIRGINVGGKNPVPMAVLRRAFEDAGHTRVGTYIQSGNVVFSSTAPVKSLEAAVEATLEATFGIPLVVVVRSDAQLRAVIADAPEGFGGTPDVYNSDVVFLKSPLTSAQAMGVVQVREGVDRAWPGEGVIYFQRLSAERTKSRMSRIIGTPPYQLMTIRNWATTTRMAAMLDE